MPPRCLSLGLLLAFALSALGAESDLMDRWLFNTITIPQHGGGAPTDTVPKGLVVRVGEQREAMVCYDLDLCRMAGAWTGDLFLPEHYELRAEFPSAGGQIAFATMPVAGFQRADPKNRSGEWKDPRVEPFGPLSDGQFRGMYVQGRSVLLVWRVRGAEILERPSYNRSDGVDCFIREFDVAPHADDLLIPLSGAEGAENRSVMAWTSLEEQPRAIDGQLFLRVPASSNRTSFEAKIYSSDDEKALAAAVHFERPPKVELSKGGFSPEVPKSVVVRGEVSTDHESAYVVDSIELSGENPWHASIRLSGLDFFSDGRAALCTRRGDVFILSGLDSSLAQVTWRRFATGLSEPLGLRIVDDELYVTCQDGLVRLLDSDGSGQATFYERFNNDVEATSAKDDFAADLQTDAAGNFYFTKAAASGLGKITRQSGTLMRVSPDGRSLDIVAAGFRSPDGLSIGPHGEITCSDDAGPWIPADKIAWVERNSFQGFKPTAQADPPPIEFAKPLCWLPTGIDGSPSGEVWVPDDARWGPWRGELLHTSCGEGALFGVMRESVFDPTKPDCCDQSMQGGVARFPLKLSSGLSRARFNPADGQLYAVAARGGSKNGRESGFLQRVRYTGAVPRMPIEMHVKKDGIELRFTCSLNTQKACNTDNWKIEAWNYDWSGSEPKEVPAKNRVPLAIKSISAGTDDRSVFIEIPDLKPAMQMSIEYQIQSDEGGDLSGEVLNTIYGFGE
ncbi:MAG TPA: DUF6797 domain-containing protein [Chthoniobacteraceae bacterium]